jgi:Leucine-rich repeat (LRR) protein
MEREDFLESLSKYPNFDSIQHLDISKKRLRKIKVLPKNLVILNCSRNRLTNLFEEGCNIPETLVRIDCSHNRLRNINQLKDLPNLKILDCSHNIIRKITYPINVEEMYMNNNLISGKLEFKEGLKILNVDNNRITSFDFDEIPPLIHKIYLNSNRIEVFPDIFGRFSSTLIMELKNNPIIRNEAAGKNLYNIILRDKPLDYELKLKLNIE